MDNFNSEFNEILNQIKYPLITEKTILLNNEGKYTFIVNKILKKPQIKYSLQKLLNITITDLKVINLPPKMKRVGKFRGQKSLYKKVYIKLKAGEQLTTLFN